MNRYRKFRLLNSKGTYFELTEKNFKVFANNPRGLGFSKTASVLRLGDENFLTYIMYNLDTIETEILFYDDNIADKYQKYVDFIHFLSFKPIYLLYQRPNSFDWYRRRIEAMSLSKSEVSFDDSMLHCPLVMQPLTFWEDNEVNVIETNNTDVDGGKIYPITYPFTYGKNSLTNIHLYSNGLIDTPLKLTINGRVTDPQYIIYNEQNEIYGRGKFNGTFDNVFVNSNESEEEIQLMYNSLILDNPLGYQDLTIGSPDEIYVTFLKAKAGLNKISFIVDVGFEGSVRIEWRNRYVTI